MNGPASKTIVEERLASQILFLKKHLMEKDGSVNTGFNFSKKAPVAGVKDLLSQAAAIRMLLAGENVTAWNTLFREKNLDSVLKIYRFMEEKLWDEKYGIYRDSTHWQIQSDYTPANVGSVIGALRELSLHLP